MKKVKLWHVSLCTSLFIYLLWSFIIWDHELYRFFDLWNWSNESRVAFLTGLIVKLLFDIGFYGTHFNPNFLKNKD